MAAHRAHRRLELVRSDRSKIRKIGVGVFELDQAQPQLALGSFEMSHVLEQHVDNDIAIDVEQQDLGHAQPDARAVGALELDEPSFGVAPGLQHLAAWRPIWRRKEVARQIHLQRFFQRLDTQEPKHGGIGFDQPLVERRAKHPDVGAIKQGMQPGLAARHALVVIGTFQGLPHRRGEPQETLRGLDDVVGQAGLHRPHRDLFVAGKREHDHRHLGMALADRLEDLQPVRPREFVLGDDKIDPAATERQRESGGIPRFDQPRGGKLSRQHDGGQTTVLTVVVDQENARILFQAATPPTPRAEIGWGAPLLLACKLIPRDLGCQPNSRRKRPSDCSPSWTTPKAWRLFRKSVCFDMLRWPPKGTARGALELASEPGMG